MSYPVYEEMRDSGVAWLRDTPRHWKVQRLKFSCQINPPKSEVTSLPGELPVSFLPMEKVGTEGELELDTTRLLDSVLQGFTYFRDGDVIVAKITPCFENGKGALCRNLVNSIGFGSTEFHVLRSQSGYSEKFIYYLTRSYPFRSIGTALMQGSAGQKRVQDEFVGDFTIAWPPLAEQQHIATFLDVKMSEIDELIAMKEQQVRLLQQKRMVLISRVVTKGLDPHASMRDSGVAWLGDVPMGWNVLKVKFVATKIGSGKTPRGGATIYGNEGVVFLRSQNIYDDGLRLDDVVFISDQLDSEMSGTRVYPGDILLNITGASIGRTSVIPNIFPRANVNQHVCIIRPAKGIIPEYLSYCLKSSIIKQQILSFENGSSREGLNFEQVGELIIVVPQQNLLEQNKVITYLDRETAHIDSLVTIIQEQTEKLRTYRQALITAAVTGKIHVRGTHTHLPTEVEG